MEIVYLYICLIPVLISVFIGIIVVVNNEIKGKRNKNETCDKHIDKIVNTKEKSDREL